MHPLNAALLVFLCLIAGNAYAGVLVSPETVNFSGPAPERLTITVENDTGFDKDLSVEFFAPRELEATFLTKAPEKLEAGEKARIIISLEPEISLSDSAYTGTLIVKMDEMETEKKVELVFSKFKANPVDFSLEATGVEEGEFKIIAHLKNHSNEEVKAWFLGLQGMPLGWSHEVQRESFSIRGRGEGDYFITVKPSGGFEGEITAAFKANGLELKKSVEVSVEGETPSAGFFSFTGLLAGFAEGGSIFLIDLVLAVVAAILLIAFLSRLVQRISGA